MCLSGFIMNECSGQWSFSATPNYIFSMKWHRDSYYAYYTDVSNNHTASIQGEGVYEFTRLFSPKKNEWDQVSIGVSSELIYLPFAGLHYGGFESLGIINGMEQWVHFYDDDRFRFIYLVPGIKAKYEIHGLGFIAFMKAYPIQLSASSSSRLLNLNNNTGKYEYSSWTEGKTERVRNPHIFTELTVGINMSSKSDFVLGFQWTARSAINLVHTIHHVDNREQAFRNVKIGWRFGLD